MDSGLAVILGAVIALVGSVLTPWVKDRIDRRSEDARELRRRRGEAILRFLRALDVGRDPVPTLPLWQRHSEVGASLAELAMLATGPDARHIENVLAYAKIRGSAGSDPGFEPSDSTVVTQTTFTLMAWHRGELKGESIWWTHLRRLGPDAAADIRQMLGPAFATPPPEFR